MSALTNMIKELRERKLWPIAVVLIVALVAVPLLLSKKAPTNLVTPQPSTSLPYSTGSALPAITVDDYWEARCYALEVEWVANVVSAALVSAAMLCGGKTAIPVIITPTTRGMMKAREILGVRR